MGRESLLLSRRKANRTFCMNGPIRIWKIVRGIRSGQAFDQGLNGGKSGFAGRFKPSVAKFLVLDSDMVESVEAEIPRSCPNVGGKAVTALIQLAWTEAELAPGRKQNEGLAG